MALAVAMAVVPGILAALMGHLAERVAVELGGTQAMAGTEDQPHPVDQTSSTGRLARTALVEVEVAVVLA